MTESKSETVRCLKRGPSLGPHDILFCAVVRNQTLRLPDVLRHHRALGVDRFVVVDNGSDDGTLDLLMDQPDCDVYAAAGSYAASKFGMDWVHPLLDAFADGHWVMNVDADELLVYPHCERTDLHAFCAFLDKSGNDSVFALMLDMYSDRRVADTAYAAGDRLIDTCPYFDSGPYQTIRSAPFPTFELQGGPRKRMFWAGAPGIHPPTVSAVPLVKWRTGYRYISSRHYMGPSPTMLAPVTGALLHFKFLSDFHTNAVIEAARGEHFAGAREYKLYRDKMEADPAMTLIYPGSVRYRDTAGLVSQQICRTSPEWERLNARR